MNKENNEQKEAFAIIRTVFEWAINDEVSGRALFELRDCFDEILVLKSSGLNFKDLATKERWLNSMVLRVLSRSKNNEQ